MIEVLELRNRLSDMQGSECISEGAMTALGISKRQEFYNRERRHWRGADADFYIAAEVEKFIKNVV